MNSPPSIATATPTSAFLKRRIRSSAQTALAAGTRVSARPIALMTKSLTESLKAGLPSLSLPAEPFSVSRSFISASSSQSTVR